MCLSNVRAWDCNAIKGGFNSPLIDTSVARLPFRFRPLRPGNVRRNMAIQWERYSRKVIVLLAALSGVRRSS